MANGEEVIDSDSDEEDIVEEEIVAMKSN